MPTWPFNRLTVEQAWGFANGVVLLDDLPKKAKLELAGLSAFGESGNPPQLLSQSLDPITEGAYPGTWNPWHVRSGLLRLDVRQP